MIFLELVTVNVLMCVICMYLDRYVLDNFCKEHYYISRAFKVWLLVTFLSVLIVLFSAIPMEDPIDLVVFT